MPKFFDLPRRLASGIREFFSSDLTSEEQRFISSFSSRWLSVVWIFIAASVPILITVEVVSAQQYANGLPQSENAGYLKDNLTTRLNFNPTLDKATDSRLMHSTLLAEYLVKITAHRTQDGISFDYENLVTYRYDTMIALSGLWLVLLYALRIIGANREGQSTKIALQNPITSKKITKLNEDTISLSKAADNISVLKDEVQFARGRALDIYQRSSIMLVSGIAMAFVGVGAFYASLPTIGAETKAEAFFMQSLRPTAMLIFVEAVAWFLLRQYRSLSDDYRRFHRMAQRRADFLAAFMTINQPNTSDAAVLVLTTLLQEPTTLVLKSGESTETLEESKAAINNPIFDLATSVLQRVPMPSANDKKDPT